MALLGRALSVSVTGTAQQILWQDTGGARVQSVYLESGPSSPALGKVAVFATPASGRLGVEIASVSGVGASGSVAKLDVAQPVEVVRVEATKGGGGNGALTVWVTSGNVE